MNVNLKRIFISCSRLVKITERLSSRENNVLLSANLHISDFSMNKKKSFIEILKCRGPRMDFWGILLVTLAQSLYEEPIFFFVSKNVRNHYPN